VTQPVLRVDRREGCAIVTLDRPAAMNALFTGGFESALACDVLIASTTARFIDTRARRPTSPPACGANTRRSSSMRPRVTPEAIAARRYPRP
jgi:enoyl-CoA hydratase/carnithine racemase